MHIEKTMSDNLLSILYVSTADMLNNKNLLLDTLNINYNNKNYLVEINKEYNENGSYKASLIVSESNREMIYLYSTKNSCIDSNKRCNIIYKKDNNIIKQIKFNNHEASIKDDILFSHSELSIICIEILNKLNEKMEIERENKKKKKKVVEK